MIKLEDSIVGFIGLGLMGGALAMGLRKQGPRKIWGYDIKPAVIEAAADFLARVSGEDPRCCPHCGVGRWHTVEIVMARRYDPPAPAPRCRDGPP